MTEAKQIEEAIERHSRVILIGAYKRNNEKELCIEHLDELELLAKTYGVIVERKLPTALRKYDTATFLTKGKLEEVVEIVNEVKPDLIIFDDEIQPSQQRNLEKIFGRTVMDRTEVILEVFAQRAQTKEAQLQIELAKVQYQFPRLKRMWTHLERQAGGSLFLKGMGEKQIEIDRRLLSKRLHHLETELKAVKAHRETQRNARQRSGIPSFAIVGYTNAGKSTLLNALTDAGVFVEDKLFATLDTTTRKFMLPNNQEILLIDTVGFIRKIPHTLVAAFKSTLEEAVQTDILLHVIDVSHPMAEEQALATHEVLMELDNSERPIITVLNKIDLCEDHHMIDRLRIKYPRTIRISALEREGFGELLDAMVEELKKRRQLVRLRIPQCEYEVVSEVMRSANVLHKDYEENDVLIEVELPKEMVGRLEKYLIIPKVSG